MENLFAVVFETDYSTKVLFTGTKKECQTYMRMNPEICSTFTFLQELDEAYYE